jgi:hypothetical protein
MNKQIIIRNLGRHLKSLSRKDQETVSDGYTAENVVVACFQVLHECGRSKQSRDAWIDRQGFRKTLERIQRRYTKPKAKRAMKRLIELAITELEACSWRTQFSVGALPIDREPKPMTAAQREARRQNMTRLKAQQRAEREALERARNGWRTEEGIGMPPSVPTEGKAA